MREVAIVGQIVIVHVIGLLLNVNYATSRRCTTTLANNGTYSDWQICIFWSYWEKAYMWHHNLNSCHIHKSLRIISNRYTKNNSFVQLSKDNVFGNKSKNKNRYMLDYFLKVNVHFNLIYLNVQ